ncbi:MAG: glycosyltransferase [Gemmatimonadales bacterium]
MTWITWLPGFVLGVATCYALIVCVVAIGLLRLPRSRAVPDDEAPRVSVLVACRNEEVDLPRCLAALAQLDYPADHLELILVDDQSTDRTDALLEAFARSRPHVRVLSTGDAPDTGLRAKARGIAWAAHHATGDWLFITDADGAVPPGWVRHMLSGVNDRIGIIGGMMVGVGGTWPGLVERVSWGYTLPFAFGMAGWGVAFIAVGPNMAVRRSIYVAAGGLERAPFTIAEDLALFRMVESAGYRALGQASPETTVRLTPVPSFRHLLSQQRRWLRGGFEGDWRYWVGLVGAFGFHFLFSVGLVVGLVVSLPSVAVAWGLKFAADALLIGVEARRTGEPRLILLVPVAVAYTAIAFFWIPLSFLLTRTVEWQGEGYRLSYPVKANRDAGRP